MSARFGVAPPDVAATMTGLQRLQGSLNGTLPWAPIAEGMNFHMVEVEDGRVVFDGEPGEQHLNPMGWVHGGWAMTLIDSACGCAGFSTLPVGINFTTLETKVSFTRAVNPGGGVLRTTGTVVSRGRSIITTEAHMTDADGRLVAHGTSTLMVLAPKVPTAR